MLLQQQAEDEAATAVELARHELAAEAAKQNGMLRYSEKIAQVCEANNASLCGGCVAGACAAGMRQRTQSAWLCACALYACVSALTCVNVCMNV